MTWCLVKLMDNIIFTWCFMKWIKKWKTPPPLPVRLQYSSLCSDETRNISAYWKHLWLSLSAYGLFICFGNPQYMTRHCHFATVLFVARAKSARIQFPRVRYTRRHTLRAGTGIQSASRYRNTASSWLSGSSGLTNVSSSTTLEVSVTHILPGQGCRIIRAGSKGGLARNIYTKSERLTLSSRVTLAERVNLYNGQRVIIPIKIKTCAIQSGPGTPSEPPGLDNLYLFPRTLVGTFRWFPFYFLELYILHFFPPPFLRSSFCSFNFLLPPFNLMFSFTFHSISVCLLFLLSFSSTFFIYIFLLSYFIFLLVNCNRSQLILGIIFPLPHASILNRPNPSGDNITALYVIFNFWPNEPFLCTWGGSSQ